MREVAIFVLCLLLIATGTLHARGSVEVVAPEKSRQRIRIDVQVDGWHQKGVKVEVYRYRLGVGEEVEPLVSLISDNDGQVTTPVLPLGTYHLIAVGEGNLRSDLYVYVASKSGKEISSFSLRLVEDPNPTQEQLWAAADNLPITDRLGTFNGTVFDPSGAVIHGVSIQIVKRGTKGREQIARLKSTEDGRFSAQLPEGVYIALFSMPGFRVAFVPFEVTKESSEELRLTLQLGDVTENVRVSRQDTKPSSELQANDQRPRTND